MTLPCLAFLSASALLGPGDCKAPTNATVVVTTVPAPTKDGDLAAYVDPFTGTAGTGHTHPSACVPFGMVQAGPDTGGGRNADWAYCSGYQYRDTSVLGYSQTHLSGTGCPDYNDVQLLPFAGELGELPARRAIDKATERAEPGYYAVVQPDDGVRVEIAAAKRAAIYRLTWANAGEAHVLLNLPFGQNCPKTYGAKSAVEGADGVSGSHFRKGWIQDRLLAYAFAFGRPWKSVRELPRQAPDEAPRYVATFDVAAGEALLMKVALSMTGSDGAKANLAADIPGWGFDSVRAAARARWNGILARTTCEGTDGQKRNWYTALYHLYVQPNDYADADGRFSAADGKVYASPDGTYMTTLSLWDTFRAAQPWYTLAAPETVVPVVNSFLSHYKTYGRLPVLSYGGKNIDCMVGNHSVPVIADAWLKGFRGFDAALAFEAVTNTLTVAHPGKPKENWDLYDRYGYFPCDVIKGESVSRTLECAYDDACAARFATALGKPEAAAFFARRAGYWKNVFDPSIRFARGKTTKGTWRTPFDPYAFGHGDNRDNDFTEGNAFQYTWHVMQDVPGLVAAMGGRERFVETLDALFTSPARMDKATSDISGMIGQYVHGNEPSHHVIYLYPQVGRPEKAAERIREVFDTQYHVGPEGLCGNDDCGQMSAWYVFSAMGFYPFDPCGGEYVLGAPQVPQATLRLADGKTFTVVAKGLSKANKYVKSATLNGRPVTDWKIRHADIVKGGELVFEMAAVLPPVNAVVVQDAPGYNSWPMIQAFGTNLVCAYSRDSRLPADGHYIDPGSRDSYARVSADGGRTWSVERVVAADPVVGEVNEGIGLDSTGAVLAWVRCWGAPERRRHELYRTVDGVTFERLAVPRLDPMPMQVTDIVRVPGLGLVSPWFAGSYAGGGNSWGVLVSGDDGLTWEQRMIEKGLAVKDWVTEPSLVSLGDGKLLIVGRCEQGLGPQFQVTSADGGRTWKKARTNIGDVHESTPSLVYDARTGLVANYYYQRGARRLKRRVARAMDVFDNPTAWPEPEVLAEGFEPRNYDAGNVNVTRLHGRSDVCAWYTGTPSNAAVVVTSASVPQRAQPSAPRGVR